jgi:hypothetical protein
VRVGRKKTSSMLARHNACGRSPMDTTIGPSPPTMPNSPSDIVGKDAADALLVLLLNPLHPKRGAASDCCRRFAAHHRRSRSGGPTVRHSFAWLPALHNLDLHAGEASQFRIHSRPFLPNCHFDRAPGSIAIPLADDCFTFSSRAWRRPCIACALSGSSVIARSKSSTARS